MTSTNENKSEMGNFNRNDLKHVSIVTLGSGAVWYLANISSVASFLKINFGFSDAGVLAFTIFLTYIAKRFIQNNQK